MSDPTTTTASSSAETAATARGKRKVRIGEVISNKMTKTITVQVERRFAHPRYKKVVTGYKKLYAHDEKSEAKVGDRVRIEETRPLSKMKRWRLVEVVHRSSGVTPVAV
jgi:small subunit ribosomal protein S17